MDDTRNFEFRLAFDPFFAVTIGHSAMTDEVGIFLYGPKWKYRDRKGHLRSVWKFAVGQFSGPLSDRRFEWRLTTAKNVFG